MKIIEGTFKIGNISDDIITDIELFSLKIYKICIFRYKINNKYKYVEHYYDDNKNYIFFEILCKSPLWNIEFKHNNIYCTYTIYIEPLLINNYKYISQGLNNTIINLYNKLDIFISSNFINKSIIPFCEIVNPPNDFKIKLYEYQQKTLSKMLQIEKNENDFQINYTIDMNIGDINFIFDPITNLIVDKHSQLNIKSQGGILSDEMGLGKTISSIALIASNPSNILNNIEKISISKKDINIKKINSKATLILCPSHLTKQWQKEISKCNPFFKVLLILTKTDYNHLTFNDIIEADIIISSHQFIMNFKFYPTIHYRTCTASNFSFSERTFMIKQFINNRILDVDFETIKNMKDPLFEFFYFHRLILDEGHEIFGELSSISTCRYMSEWLSNIDSNYYWYISGTPFINFTGIMNCAKFINLELIENDKELLFNHTNINKNNQLINCNFINKDYIWNYILNNICIRHLKSDVENQIKIPGYIEHIIWVKLTELERNLYNTKKDKVSNIYLQQLCCHPLLIESSKKIFGDSELDLALMQDKLIDHHKNNYEIYNVKLSKLDPTNKAYFMLKKVYETQISESKYLYSILEKMKTPELIEEQCAICIDDLTIPTVTACGHLFCNECIKMWLNTKKKCPLCKVDLTGKDLLVMNLNKPNNDISDDMIQKYGSKLGKLISIVKIILNQKDTRIIIFSQWDDMLSLIGKTLVNCGISNCFVKGNVWSRNSAINKFKSGKTLKGDDNKVIMLSLKNSASGTNLTEATHIFFVEPINANKEECKVIENQAMARACRIGQTKQVNLIRILIEDTIEETIYRNNYNKNIDILNNSNIII